MSNLWRLTRFLKPYRRQAFWSLVTLVAAAFAELAIPRLMQRTVDQGILRMDMAVILQTMFIMLGFALASAILMIINSITSVRASQGFGADVRGALFRTIQSLSFANIDR
ncbi:MAG: ABC transporter ATP-binding protein, partial [Chloroflexi bacterium]|nr:ABC transporter ATP-binding protein [Chloroflexota bacterium]